MQAVTSSPDAPNGLPKRSPGSARSALRFVLLIGVISFFADFTYEAARGVLGQYMASLGAGAATISTVTGFGALIGYALRLVSGREADRTGKFWPITIFGYFIQLLAVPALALVGNWPAAAALICVERTGKATRNPPRDAMLSHAAKEMGGYGWAFGVHEAFDQAGAMVGPLAMAGILALHHSYRFAFPPCCCQPCSVWRWCSSRIVSTRTLKHLKHPQLAHTLTQRAFPVLSGFT